MDDLLKWTLLCLLGAQWGDEGKGKIIDLLAKIFGWTVRFNGADNAGHTIVIRGKKYVLRLVPSGIFHGRPCVLGNGMAVNPAALLAEIKMLAELGIDCTGLLFLSNRAHLITPWNKLVEKGRRGLGPEGVGTTGKGVGPCYEQKAARIGIRAGMVFDKKRLQEAVEKSYCHTMPELKSYLQDYAEQFIESALQLAPYICDTGAMLREAMKKGGSILAEGAQATMLDIDHGTYPDVTSSSCTIGGVFSGLGIPLHQQNAVLGVAKAYCTRVGGGPLPCAMPDDLANHVRTVGQEFGASTGRPRRPAWLDLRPLKYAVEVNGMAALALMKADVLADIPEIPICVGYNYKGKLLEEFPEDPEVLDNCEPVYKIFPGWEGMSGVTKFEKLPYNFRLYVDFIEKQLQVQIPVISTGPERHETIIRQDVSVPGLEWLHSIDPTA